MVFFLDLDLFPVCLFRSSYPVRTKPTIVLPRRFWSGMLENKQKVSWRHSSETAGIG